MNGELFEMLAPVCRGSTAFLAIGNVDRGDDGAGMALGRKLRDAGLPFVFEGGIEPERVLPRVRDLGCEAIVFLDAVDIAAEPGSVVVMDALELAGRYPQVSTHKLSLGTLARLAADGNESRVYLIGIQPETIALEGEGLSSAVDATVRTLAQAIADVLLESHHAIEERVCH
jgi:hydrogenase maturation protease